MKTIKLPRLTIMERIVVPAHPDKKHINEMRPIVVVDSSAATPVFLEVLTRSTMKRVAYDRQSGASRWAAAGHPATNYKPFNPDKINSGEYIVLSNESGGYSIDHHDGEACLKLAEVIDDCPAISGLFRRFCKIYGIR